MLVSLFTNLEAALSQNAFVVGLAAFSWGVVSILLSPCHFSGIPVALLSFQDRVKVPSLIPLEFAAGAFLSLLTMACVTFFFGQAVLQFSLPADWIFAFSLLASAILLLDIVSLNFSVQPNQVRSGLLSVVFFGLTFGMLVGPCTLAFAMPVIVVSGISSGLIGFKGLLIFGCFGVGHLLSMFALGIAVQRSALVFVNFPFTRQIKKGLGAVLLVAGLYLLYRSGSRT